MQRLVCAFLVGFTASCTAGAPPGFPRGDHWTIPLVGPLEDGLLIAPVRIHGHGPYLFAIDPDARVSAIEEAIVHQAGLWTGYGPHWIDETDTGRRRSYAELIDLEVGGLTIDRRDVMVFPSGAFDTEERHISGILGQDVLAESLVFGFDREQGIATLSTVGAFVPPPGAVAIHYQPVASRSAGGEHGAPNASRLNLPSGQLRGTRAVVGPVPRRLGSVEIGGRELAMHLDLGATMSQLATTHWQAAGLVPVSASTHLVDETATARNVNRAVVGMVKLGGLPAGAVGFAPYVERRFSTEGVDGALGLDFFRPYAVYASWHHRTYYLKPRGDAAATATARMGRWGTLIPACPHPGCVTAELRAGEAGVVLHVERDAEAADRALEVYLGVAPASDRPAGPLIVELPKHASTLTVPVSADYAGATLRVLDVSPFPRACAGEVGCVAAHAYPVATTTRGIESYTQHVQ